MNPIKITTFIFTLLVTQASLSEVSQLERDALVAIYQNTNGDEWTNNNNWLQNDPCDNNWFGIICTDGEITKLELIKNNLTGVIPSEIGDLIHLHELSFNDNQLTGNIPYEIGNLKNLGRLSFGKNKISGYIPDSIGNLTNLYGLYLQQNQLTGHIPENIGNLTELRSLYFHSNQLSGNLPETIGNLIDMRVLSILENNLSGDIPTSIINLKSLLIFLYGYNALQIPNSEVANFLFSSSCFDDLFTITCEQDSQTTPPTNFQVNHKQQSITLSWDSIEYNKSGGYQIWLSESEAGPFRLIHQTPDKATTDYKIEDVSENKDYYFQLKTFTNPHNDNPNFVVSQAVNPEGIFSSEITFPMQSQHSGSWYNPDQSGHGLAVEILPGNIGLVYWYVYDNQGNQMWLIGSGAYDGHSIQADMTILNGAMFPPDFNSNDLIQKHWGTINLEFTGERSINYSWIPQRDSILEAGQMSMQQLTRIISKNENDNGNSSAQVNATHSGSWFNPNQNGHGFAVEILPNNVGLIYWYVYDNAGNQLWLIGNGTYKESQLNVDLTLVSGSRFPPNFDSNDLKLTDWGTATLTFENCNNAMFSWQPDTSQTAYSSGQMPIQRLTQLTDLQCID